MFYEIKCFFNFRPRSSGNILTRRLCRNRRDDNELYRSNSFKFERFERKDGNETGTETISSKQVSDLFILMKSNYVNSIRVSLITNPYFTIYPLGLISAIQLIPIGMNKTMFCDSFSSQFYIYKNKKKKKHNET